MPQHPAKPTSQKHAQIQNGKAPSRTRQTATENADSNDREASQILLPEEIATQPEPADFADEEHHGETNTNPNSIVSLADPHAHLAMQQARCPSKKLTRASQHLTQTQTMPPITSAKPAG